MLAILQYIVDKLQKFTVDIAVLMGLLFIGIIGMILSTKDLMIESKLVKATIKKHERNNNV